MLQTVWQHMAPAVYVLPGTFCCIHDRCAIASATQVSMFPADPIV